MGRIIRMMFGSELWERCPNTPAIFYKDEFAQVVEKGLLENFGSTSMMPAFGIWGCCPNGMQGTMTAGMQAVLVYNPIIPQEKRSLTTLAISSLLDFIPEEFGLPPF